MKTDVPQNLEMKISIYLGQEGFHIHLYSEPKNDSRCSEVMKHLVSICWKLRFLHSKKVLFLLSNSILFIFFSGQIHFGACCLVFICIVFLLTDVSNQTKKLQQRTFGSIIQARCHQSLHWLRYLPLIGWTIKSGNGCHTCSLFLINGKQKGFII